MARTNCACRQKQKAPAPTESKGQEAKHKHETTAPEILSNFSEVLWQRCNSKIKEEMAKTNCAGRQKPRVPAPNRRPVLNRNKLNGQ